MHITVSHSHSHRLFLSTIFASNLPARILHLHLPVRPPAFRVVLCCVWFLVFLFSFLILRPGARRGGALCLLFLIVHTKVYFYSMISPHANVLNSLSCAIRLSSLSISNYWCFHWLLARNVNVLLLSISAFLLLLVLLVLWHCAYVFSFTCKNEWLVLELSLVMEDLLE